MINKFKALDNIGLISYLHKLVLAIRQFFATKSEMDVVATALTDLDNRKIEASDIPTSLPANGGNADTSDYAKYLRGRDPNGNYYEPESVNCNIIAEWNTKSDNRWYLKAASTYECRVEYATSAGNAEKLDGKPTSDFIQNISVGNVNTVSPGTPASVKISGEKPNVVLDFEIPRGYQGDMAEKDDSGYTNSNGDTVVDYCEAILEWQFLSDPGLNCEFVNILQVPIPSRLLPRLA